MKRTVLILLVAAVAFAWSAPKFGSFKDPRDGQVYKTVKIGYQTWMAQNLNYGKALEGEATLSSGEKWCYGDTLANCEKYGGLYSWDVAQNSCPAGWHLPAKDEWETLVLFIRKARTEKVCGEKYLDGSCKTWKDQEPDVNKELKSRTDEWEEGALKKGMRKGTDTWGFSALPVGNRNSDGTFVSLEIGYWSATLFENESNALYMCLSHLNLEGLVDALKETHHSQEQINSSMRSYIHQSHKLCIRSVEEGIPVRCVKD